MYRNIFLLLALLLFTGCAERGYKLTTHIQTRTSTAESVIDMKTSTKEVPQELKKMKDAVKKELINLKDTSKIKKPKVQIKSLKKENQNTTIILESKYTEEQLLSSSTEDLIFAQVSKTYHTFGDSEIHGHVIYMNASGQETKLNNTRIYILASTDILDNWYENYYLTNNRENNFGTKVSYINSTYLNLSKNFAFHGIAPGDYFVIIVSDTPITEENNKKIYIAKKIHVEKRKKIMAVFSKKL